MHEGGCWVAGNWYFDLGMLCKNSLDCVHVGSVHFPVLYCVPQFKKAETVH